MQYQYYLHTYVIKLLPEYLLYTRIPHKLAVKYVQYQRASTRIHTKSLPVLLHHMMQKEDMQLATF